MKVHRIPTAPIAAVVAALLIAAPGCSLADSPDSPAPDTPAAATSGILTVLSSGAQLTYGVIDPSSGHYSQLVTFKLVGAQQQAADDDIAVSPDFTKYAGVDRSTGAARTVAGWFDPQGKFTAVAQLDTPGPFGGAGSTTEAIGFDRAGNYYYRSQSSAGYAVFKVPAGSTSGAQQVPLSSDRAQAGAWLNFDGTMQFGCTVGVHNWLGPDAVVSASGRYQIDKWNVTGRDKFGCPVTDSGHELLPSTNTTNVSDAVGSPDGTKVAFLYADSAAAHGVDIYIVAADGTSQPTKLAVQFPSPQPYEGLTLLRWS